MWDDEQSIKTTDDKAKLKFYKEMAVPTPSESWVTRKSATIKKREVSSQEVSRASRL
jgi:hypothetical protein